MTSVDQLAVFDRNRALVADADDPLAAFRDRYLPQTDDVVAYLDGNSLGRPLASIATAWSEFTAQQWAGRLPSARLYGDRLGLSETPYSDA